MGSNIDEPKSNAIRMREFSGFYAMLVKNIGSQWQLALKYDSYDPNTKIADNDIDVKEDLVTNTIGFGLHNYSFSNIRVSLWYDMINTQTTSNTKFASDPIDNQLTLRLQYKF
jgi:phosphate-selective porin